MELLTTRAPIIEQESKGCKSLAIPKPYIERRKLAGKDIMYMNMKKESNQLIVTYSEYFREDAKKRSILSSNGYCRINLPQSDNHKDGSRWDAFTDNEGLLRYELLN